MTKPIIIAVDDEVPVLNAVSRDLRTHFQDDYRIVKAESAEDALEAVKEFKRRNEPIALFLVDQRMPSMSGVEFLAEAIRLYPETKRVLLTAYADTDAAIASINEIGLDYYLSKPWDPPEERLYPVLDDLLSDWVASVPVPYDGIRVAGTLWSARSHDVKDFLARSQIPYQWLDIERNAEARDLVESTSRQPRRSLVSVARVLLAVRRDRRLARCHRPRRGGDGVHWCGCRSGKRPAPRGDRSWFSRRVPG